MKGRHSAPKGNEGEESRVDSARVRFLVASLLGMTVTGKPRVDAEQLSLFRNYLVGKSLQGRRDITVAQRP